MIRNKMADIKSGDNLLIVTNFGTPNIVNIISVDEDKTSTRIQMKRFPDGIRREPTTMKYQTIQGYCDWTDWYLIWYIKDDWN